MTALLEYQTHMKVNIVWVCVYDLEVPYTCIHSLQVFKFQSMTIHMYKAVAILGGFLRFPETSQNWAGARARASS